MSTNNDRGLKLVTSISNLDDSKVLLFSSCKSGYQMCFRQETTAVYDSSRSTGVVSTSLSTYIDRWLRLVTICANLDHKVANQLLIVVIVNSIFSRQRSRISHIFITRTILCTCMTWYNVPLNLCQLNVGISKNVSLTPKF